MTCKEENSKTKSEDCASDQTLTKPPESDLMQNKFSGKEIRYNKFQAVSDDDNGHIQENPCSLEEPSRMPCKLENGPFPSEPAGEKEMEGGHSMSDEVTSHQTSSSPSGGDSVQTEFDMKGNSNDKFQAVPNDVSSHLPEHLSVLDGLETLPGDATCISLTRTVNLQAPKQEGTDKLLKSVPSMEKHQDKEVGVKAGKDKNEKQQLQGKCWKPRKENKGVSFSTPYLNIQIPDILWRAWKWIIIARPKLLGLLLLASLLQGTTASPVPAPLTVQDSGIAEQGQAFSLICKSPQSTDTTSSYIWYKDGDIIRNETRQVLTFTRLAQGDAGNYQCRLKVADTAPLQSSKVFQLLVFVSGNIVGSMAFQVYGKETAAQGQLHDLTCLVGSLSSINIKLTFVWFKDGRMLPDETGQVLRISKPTQKDIGLYQCGVSISHKHYPKIFQLSEGFDLYVEGEGQSRNNWDLRRKTSGNASVPVKKFTAHIVGSLAFQVHEGETAVQGQPHKLTCLVGGPPSIDKDFTFVWFKDGRMLHGERGKVLTISDPRKENSTVYQCGISISLKLNPKNFLLSKGLNLYGEDHTEKDEDIKGPLDQGPGTPLGNASIRGNISAEGPGKRQTSSSDFLNIGLPVIVGAVLLIILVVFVLCKREHLKRKCCSKGEQSWAEEGTAMNTLKTDHAIQSSGEVADQNACTKLMQANGH